MYMAAEASFRTLDFKAGIHSKFGDSSTLIQSQRTGGGASARTVLQATRRLQAATVLLAYRDAFEPFVLALSGQSFIPQSQVEALLSSEELQAALSRDYSLAEVEGAVEVVGRALRGQATAAPLTAAHLAFVSELHARGSLLDFLASFDSPRMGVDAFERQAGLVTAQMQGRELQSDILNTLMSAYRWLRPFATRRRPRFDSMVQLVDGLIALSASEISARTAVVRGLAEHIAFIRMMFSDSSGGGAQEMLVRVTSVAARARFVSRLAGSEGPSALTLEYFFSVSAPVLSLSPDVLAETVRSAALATPSKEQCDGIAKFVAAYPFAASYF
jgi:hypothetical protein